MADYIRDLRLEKWAAMINLRRKNPERSFPLSVLALLYFRARAGFERPRAVFIPKLDAACACCSHHTPSLGPTDHEILGKTEPTRAEIFWRKKLEKQNADVRRQGQNRRPITGSIRRHTGAYPPFWRCAERPASYALCFACKLLIMVLIKMRRWD